MILQYSSILYNSHAKHQTLYDDVYFGNNVSNLCKMLLLLKHFKYFSTAVLSL